MAASAAALEEVAYYFKYYSALSLAFVGKPLGTTFAMKYALNMYVDAIVLTISGR